MPNGLNHPISAHEIKFYQIIHLILIFYTNFEKDIVLDTAVSLFFRSEFFIETPQVF